MSDKVDLRILLAGFGGQGILFAGKVIAYAGLVEDKNVSWLPSYGPEMRGGTANCNVRICDDIIGSPLVTEPDVLIAMNQPSLDKFIDAVRPGGIVLVDSTMVATLPSRADITLLALPATKMAEDNGLKGLANIILLGKLFAQTAFCAQDSLTAGLQKCIPPTKAAMYQLNLTALKLGMEA